MWERKRQHCIDLACMLLRREQGVCLWHFCSAPLTIRATPQMVSECSIANFPFYLPFVTFGARSNTKDHWCAQQRVLSPQDFEMIGSF